LESLFSWVPFYEELADRLLAWRNRQGELIALLNRLRDEGHAVMQLTDIDPSGAKVPLTEIDPFTFFAMFNRGITDANRVALVAALGAALEVRAAPPTVFAGIPVVNNQRTWFFRWARDRDPEDIPTLWSLFERALGPSPLDSPDFAGAFDDALASTFLRFTLAIGLFWVRPNIFASLDSVLRRYAGLVIKASDLSGSRYVVAVRELARRGTSFPQLSYDAWLASEERTPESVEGPDGNLDSGNTDPKDAPTFWFVGAMWDDDDQTARFLSESIWENGFTDKLLDKVRAMRPGEQIAIKAAYNRKNNLPFEFGGKFASVMAIKAVGTITANAGDGRRVSVKWDAPFIPAREWYFYTNRTTIWSVRRDRKPYNDFLIDFTFKRLQQNYGWFLSQPYWAKQVGRDVSVGVITLEQDEQLEEDTTAQSSAVATYGIEDMLNDGVFLPRSELEDIVQLLRTRKNLILQGPPGVGKTFVAKKIAYTLIGCRDEARITRVQFHQSMSYEDFVRGLRPTPGSQGFTAVDGPFLEVAEAARVSPDDQDYVLIVEEINRGNPSAIFGELLTLLEPDKRDPESAMRLTHHRDGELPFYVPPNMYLIGTLNLADRSLTALDYALRRRFIFESLRPIFGAPYVAWCQRQGLTETFASAIADRLSNVNRTIAADPTLGPEFMIGHSYICPHANDIESSKPETWFRNVVDKQIVPLLEQYWFDNLDQVAEMRHVLLHDLQ
jgi:5-methylcytosine-specific restriction protein B